MSNPYLMILRNRLKLTRVRDWREQQQQQQQQRRQRQQQQRRRRRRLLNKLEFRTGKCYTF